MRARRSVFDEAAAKQGRADWPRWPANPHGTQVRVDLGYRSASIALCTGLDVSEATLMSAATHAARAAGADRTHAVSWSGKSTVSAQASATACMTAQGRETDARIDVGAAIGSLARLRLPKPLVVGLSVPPGSAVSGPARAAAQGRPDIVFLRPEEFAASPVLQTRSVVPWQAYLLVAGYALLVILSVAAPLLRVLRRAPDSQAGRGGGAPSMDDVQRTYDRQPSMCLGLVLAVAAMAGLGYLFVTALEAASHEGIRIAIWDLRALVAAALLSAAAGALGWLVGLAIRRRAGHEHRGGPQDQSTTGTLIQLGPTMLLIVLTNIVRNELKAAPGSRILIVSAVAGLAGAAMLLVSTYIVGRWLSRGDASAEADELSAMARGIAEAEGIDLAGVSVRESVHTQSGSTVAAVTGARRILLARSLIDALTRDELGAIIAHEVGHLRGRERTQPSRWRGTTLFGLYYLTLATVIAALTAGGATFDRWPRGVQMGAGIAFGGLFVAIFVLAWRSGPKERQREIDADLFSVRVVGDPEIVISALTKGHLLLGVPRRMKPADEAMHSHPSLDRRIAAIRAFADEG